MALNKVLHSGTQSGKRYLERRESKLVENDKMTLVIRGEADQTTAQAMTELALLKKPLAMMHRGKRIFRVADHPKYDQSAGKPSNKEYKRRKFTRPFEDPTSVEDILRKQDTSLFMFGSHSKKRPNNLVFGRSYDYHILDMFEFGIENFKSMKEFEAASITLGTKPCVVFVGEQFDTDPEMIRLKNLFIDFFRGPKVTQIRLSGIEVILQFTFKDGKIYLRCYRILLKKSGTKIPRVELQEVGPSLDLIMRRTKLASDDLFKQARRIPKAAKPKKQKNISHDPFGTKLGRIHMASQDMSKLQTTRVPGLKRKQRDQSKNQATNDSSEQEPSAKRQRSEDEEEEEDMDE